MTTSSPKPWWRVTGAFCSGRRRMSYHRFKKPGPKKMPSQKSFILHLLRHRWRRQGALRWAEAACGWFRCCCVASPLPLLFRDNAHVSIWATDNHHANLGLQTLSINLGANRTEPLFLLGFFAAIISDNQTFFFHAQAQAQKV